MFKKKIISAICCSFLVLGLPLSAEAKGGWDGIVKKIIDPKASEAYVKQVEELVELYEQGKKMQQQLENLQQSLEHYKFNDISQTYRFLNSTMDDFEKLTTEAAGVNITISEMEDNWDELNVDYTAEDMTPTKQKELEDKRKKRKEASLKYSAKIMSLIGDTTKAREQMKLIRDDLALLESGKASPVKATQIACQLITQQINEAKKTQQLMLNQAREKVQEANDEAQKAKEEQAKAERNAVLGKEGIKSAINTDTKSAFKSPFMTAADLAEAKAKETK